MHWGERRFQNEDGTLTPAGRARYGVGPAEGSNTQSRRQRIKSAKEAYKSRKSDIENRASKEWDDIDKKYEGKNGRKAASDHNDELDNALDKYRKEAADNKQQYKQSLKEAKKLTPEEKEKAKKALKIAAGVAAASLAAYGTYKLATVIQQKRTERGERLFRQYHDNFGVRLAGYGETKWRNGDTTYTQDWKVGSNGNIRRTDMTESQAKEFASKMKNIQNKQGEKAFSIYNNATNTKFDKGLDAIVKTGDAVGRGVNKVGNSAKSAANAVYNKATANKRMRETNERAASDYYTTKRLAKEALYFANKNPDWTVSLNGKVVKPKKNK